MNTTETQAGPTCPYCGTPEVGASGDGALVEQTFACGTTVRRGMGARADCHLSSDYQSMMCSRRQHASV